MKNTITTEIVLKMAFDYFLHYSKRRLTLFNFFVVISMALTTGLAAALTKKDFREYPYIGLGIGILQVIFSLVFWMIDNRNRNLTQHGENTIKAIEETYAFYDEKMLKKLKFFTNEEDETKKMGCQMQHSMSFRIIFAIFGIIGLVGAGIFLKRLGFFC